MERHVPLCHKNVPIKIDQLDLTHHFLIMKKYILIGAVALMSTTSLTTSGCFGCDDVLSLCDLTITAFTAPVEVTVGQAFDVISKIQNNEDSGECTTTEIAAATVNLLEVFSKDGNGNWNFEASKDNIVQQGISPNDLISLLQSLTFNAAGDYRLDYYDDNLNSVEERNEGNNSANGFTGGKLDLKAALQSTNNYASLYITVRPSPDGTMQITGKPLVEFH